jgi:hypothetical protein
MHTHTPPQPFIDAGQPVLALFPSTSAAYLPVAALITTFLGAACTYVGWLMLTEPSGSSSTAADSGCSSGSGLCARS